MQTTGATLSAGDPVKVLNTRYYAGATGRGYDVSPDGQRFLMIKENAPEPTAGARAPSVVVILNWSEESKARAPAK